MTFVKANISNINWMVFLGDDNLINMQTQPNLKNFKKDVKNKWNMECKV